MSQLLDNNYHTILVSLKEKIRQARLRASLKVNRELLGVYWEIGKVILAEQKEQGWGAKIIDRLAADLKSEFPDLKGLSTRSLKYMRTFAEAYPDFVLPAHDSIHSQSTENQPTVIVQGTLAQLEANTQNGFVQGMLAQLSWYHHVTLLDKIKDRETRLFYLEQTVQGGWSRDIMVHQIESGLHLRKGKITSNFKTTIAPDQSELIQQLFKDPYKFEFIYLGKEAKERDLEDALTSQLAKFLLELGQYFSFMGRQYKLMLGEREYFFDLLFYHTRLKRYIIIDLKIDDFKPEYKGKMEFYLNLADEHLKQNDDDSSIGLILCKTKDGLVAEYALRDSRKPIGIAAYKINELLPENIRGELPSIEELEAEMIKEYEELKTPAQKRFDALKEKLASLKGNEIKEIATKEILFEIFDKSLLPLYTAILARMEDFKDMFVSRQYQWQSRNKIEKLEDLAAEWKNEEYLRNQTEFYFSYRFHGFKKAGTRAFDTGFQFNYKIDTYWYGFILLNYNKQLPVIQKLYGEQLTPQEITMLADTICDDLISDIENNIENINR